MGNLIKYKVNNIVKILHLLVRKKKREKKRKTQTHARGRVRTHKTPKQQQRQNPNVIVQLFFSFRRNLWPLDLL